ncbi:MAG TPA: metal-sensitive transcriptional regulator [Nocardioidaceae bacterium]|nr:metal-sensitive transcriptional regulator [Nocardioidaceae bacterium]
MDTNTGDPAAPGYIGNKEAQLRRLRRVEGQIRGLQRMVEEDTYCIDILTQVSAATKALESVALGLLDDHLHHCLTRSAKDAPDAMDGKIAEASAAIARLVRS